MNYNKINMKNRISAFLIITLSLLCISCDFSIADLLNDKLELTPPIYLSYRTEYGKTPSRKPVQKGDVITEEMLPEVKYRSNGDNDNYFYIDGIRYYYDSEEEQTFDGWYYDELFLDKVEVGDVIEDNITIYGKWINTYVDISFSYNYGYLKSYYYYENNKEKNYRRQKIGTVLSKNNLPVITYDYDNYTFIGWYLDPYFETPAEGYVLESNITLYAKEKYNGYCTIYYTVPWSYYSDMPEKTSIQAGERLTSDYLPELYPYSGSENYEFMGWYYDYDCTQQAKVGDEVNTSITLYAKWVRKYISIYYSSGNTANYANMPETKTVENNSTMLSEYLPNLNPYSGHENCIFVGWFYDWDCTREAYVGDEITNDVFLYAKWEKSYYNIFYNFGYSSNIGFLPDAKSVELNSVMISDYLPEVTPFSGNENYRFAGWFYDWDCTQEACIGDAITDDVYLYSKWELAYVLINYETFSAADVPEQKVIDVGTVLTSDLLPELEIYSSYDNLEFAGWYYDYQYERRAYAGDILNDNILLYAKYDALPNGQFLEYWVLDADTSNDYELWNDLTSVYKPTYNPTPAELQNDYYYAGEEGYSYDSYYYDGVEYTNGSIIKKYYVTRQVSSNNLAHLLSMIRGYDIPFDITITDSNPDVEQIASILRNDNIMRCHINLYLCENCDQLTSIPDNCFEGVPYLQMIWFPSSLQIIGKNAFKGCSDLNFIDI